MYPIIKAWWDMCWFRLAPQQVPASPVLLMIAMGFYLVMDMLVALPGSGWKESLGLTLIDISALAVLTWLLLRYRGYEQRLNQTLSALAGTGSVLGIFALPLVLLAQQENVPPMAGVMWITLMVWNLAVRAHILRHALDVPFGVGLIVSTAYAVVVLLLVQWFLPVT